MSVVSLIFAIVVTYNPLDCYNVNKCIFITMRFIKRRIYLLHLNLNDIASIFSNFNMSYKFTSTVYILYQE